MHLPQLHLLRSFSEAARLGSFSQAAEILNVTQSAVSQQIRQLEQLVGTPLFQRVGRQVTLTDFGRVYLDLVRGPIAALEEGHTALRAMTGRNSVVLRLSRSFALNWLMPRMPELARRHPDISVTSLYLNPGDALDANISDAVVLSSTRQSDLSDFISEPLFVTTLCPVAAPQFGDVDIERLSTYPIIHTLRRYNDWKVWCEAAGIPPVPLDHGWSFESSSMSYAAAEHGLGIVMAEIEFVAEAIAQGRLRPVSPIVVGSEHHFHIAYTRNRFGRPAIQKFRNWLSEHTRTLDHPPASSLRT